MELLFPQEDTDESREGTEAHEYARKAAALAARGQRLADCPDPDMLRGALMYADDIAGVMRRTGVFTPVLERRVEIPRIHPLSYGTPDGWLWGSAGRRLWLWDYKYGHGRVEVERNAQFVEYAAGILDELDINGHEEQHVEVVFTVVQPRAPHPDGPVRRWVCRASDLRPLVNKQSAAAHEALGPNPVCRTGPECKHCSARHACTTFQAGVYDHLAYLGHPTPAELDPAGLSLELTLLNNALDDIKARLTGLTAQAEGLIQGGAVVPGWALGRTRPHVKWTRPAAEVFALGDEHGIDLRRPAEPITPTQAIKADLDKETIADYSHRPTGAPKLVPDHNTADEVFNNGN
jgi:hypothetical protein